MIDNLGLYYDMQITRGGRIVKKYRKRICKSFVKQFLQYLSAQFGYTNGSTGVSITDTGNVSQVVNCVSGYQYTGIHLDASAAVTTFGSQVGTGTTAVTINDYKIETLIAQGTGAGQLQYSAVVFGAPTTDATTTTTVVTRVFTNNTGNDVIVYEISLVGYNGQYYFLLARDVLASPVTLANSEGLTLNYSLKTTI